MSGPKNTASDCVVGKAEWANNRPSNDEKRTLLRLEPSQRYAVVEMGANHPGEIAALAALAKPAIALVTNAGDEHLEYHPDEEGSAMKPEERHVTLFERSDRTGHKQSLLQEFDFEHPDFSVPKLAKAKFSWKGLWSCVKALPKNFFGKNRSNKKKASDSDFGDEDVEIPEAGYTFGHLKNAQAVGDLQTLRDHGLPAVQVRLEGDPVEAVRRMI